MNIRLLTALMIDFAALVFIFALMALFMIFTSGTILTPTLVFIGAFPLAPCLVAIFVTILIEYLLGHALNINMSASSTISFLFITSLLAIALLLFFPPFTRIILLHLALIFIITPLVYVIEDSNQRHFQYALSTGNLTQVLQVLKNGHRVNDRLFDGDTLLHRAAYNGQTQTVLVLIEKGAEVNAAGQYGKTPLHLAAENGHTETTLALIQASADVNAIDKDGNTPLHLAAENGHTQTALALIQAGANVDATNDNEETSLHYAAEKGHTETALALIKKGANNVPNCADQTPLYYAINANKSTTALAIIHYGKVPYAKIPVIENNPTSEYIQRQYELANDFRRPSYARGLFHGMKASCRDTMLAGMKIHVLATGIKDGYLTIMNLLRDKPPSEKPALSSLSDDILRIILEYTGHWSSSLKINLQDLRIGHTSAKALKQPVQPEVTLTQKDCRFPGPEVAGQQGNGYRAK